MVTSFCYCMLNQYLVLFGTMRRILNFYIEFSLRFSLQRNKSEMLPLYFHQNRYTVTVSWRVLQRASKYDLELAKRAMRYIITFSILQSYLQRNVEQKGFFKKTAKTSAIMESSGELHWSYIYSNITANLVSALCRTSVVVVNKFSVPHNLQFSAQLCCIPELYKL